VAEEIPDYGVVLGASCHIRLVEDFQVLKEVTTMNIENTVEAALIETLE